MGLTPLYSVGVAHIPILPGVGQFSVRGIAPQPPTRAGPIREGVFLEGLLSLWQPDTFDSPVR